MRTRIVSWIVAAITLAALLVGAYRIVRANDAAMAGSMDGQTAKFFGH